MNTMQHMRRGAVASIPMIIGGIPFGLLFGSLASSYGLSPWFAVAMSAFVFAGSAQFVALGLIALHAPLWVIISTTFIVNLRHLLYAADLVKFVKHLPMPMRIIMGFGLIDETYAAVRPMYEVGAADEKNGHKVYLGSFLSFYVMWNVTTILGVLSGELIPGMSEWGLEFAMVATFVGIITPYLKHKAFWLCLLSAGASSIILSGLPNNLGLLVSAVIGVVMGYVVDSTNKTISDSNENMQEVSK
ncbi:AzlC family ABC transporter permease [Marinomonas sp. BSi20584]|uniref:AzlC family ABC transporter permease n=1 Tax=Marinomonas sp. BSi20584 TaxID=1594462 RepID=UPI000C1F1937|nr:AzlC family ABC transporter permease [Marinomonas sp. BSi20584]PJE56885.1 branched-chain amino acid ABC transporter permease [Marinomonas sp. BSi20584]